jgi:hypothetical protein
MFSEDYAVMRDGSSARFLDKGGRQHIAGSYQDAREFREGMAPVMIKGKWGYIGKAGKVVIAPRFRDAYSFSETLAPVQP